MQRHPGALRNARQQAREGTGELPRRRVGVARGDFQQNPARRHVVCRFQFTAAVAPLPHQIIHERGVCVLARERVDLEESAQADVLAEPSAFERVLDDVPSNLLQLRGGRHPESLRRRAEGHTVAFILLRLSGRH